jgi:diguanylate cyclase (GGDEF)-like protein
MNNLFQKIAGVLMAGAFLSLGLIPTQGFLFIGFPIFFIMPLRRAFPSAALGFLAIYLPGLLIGRVLFGVFPGNWLIPEGLALLFLFWVPGVVRERLKSDESTFSHQYQEQKEKFDIFRQEADKLKNKNNLIEKQLRQIEHMYDVIKEAGSSLNVQEMIELTKEYTEKMFDLPHFIIAVLSNDSKKYEIRIASNCDESFFRSFNLDLELNDLAAVLSREKKPVWVESIEHEPRFAKLKYLAIKSFIFIPFLVHERVIGFFCSYSLQNKFLDQEAFSNFQIFCNQISIGLQKSLLYEKVQKLSITDGLTKLYSHRYFKRRLEEEIILANRYHSQLSLLILDIDHFKHYNDDYGHVAGDHVLMEVARILKERSEVTHLAARYGGEEMVLVAPETSKEQAMELAEKIRYTIETNFFTVGRETTHVTVSLGVATYPQDARDGLDLISKADKALYAAKNRGRNRIVAYPL